MQGFPGFPEGKVRTVSLPETFFTDLLPVIDHLGEMKVTLYLWWRLSRQAGPYRFLRRDEFSADELFLRSLAASPRQAEEILDEALERAEARGTLLTVTAEDGTAGERLYFMNTPKGREAVERLRRGEWRPPALPPNARLTLGQVRSNIFNLYEQNIGPLTPLVAEELRDLAATYPPKWIETAFRLAVQKNIRRLKYIQNLLQRMRREGIYDRETASETGDDPERYAGYKSFIADDTDTD